MNIIYALCSFIIIALYILGYNATEIQKSEEVEEPPSLYYDHYFFNFCLSKLLGTLLLLQSVFNSILNFRLYSFEDSGTTIIEEIKGSVAKLEILKTRLMTTHHLKLVFSSISLFQWTPKIRGNEIIFAFSVST